MSRNLPFLALTLAFGLALAPQARAGDADPVIKALLEKEDIKFEVDADGDYKVVFDVGGGRSQLVWIRSATEKYGVLQIREIWSPGYKHSGKPIPVAIANRLLEHSHGVILGGWTSQKEFAMFVVKIPASVSAKELRDAAEAAADCADQIEKELTPTKDDL
ncbi:MAG: hypothetical protein ABI588_07695 [Arenimonas sp.]